VLAAKGANGAVCAVVDQGNDTGAVAQEGSSSCDGVQNTVQAQPRRHRRRILLQALGQSPCATNCQSGQVADAGTVAEVV
jgi:hypothetical protein